MTAVFMRAIEADCDCLEKGHCSRWLVTYCGHSNAPVGVRYERVSLYASSSCMLSCPNLGTLRDVLACRKFHLLTMLWKVTTKQLQQWCTMKGGIASFESSAKEAINVEQAFQEAARKALAQEMQHDQYNDFPDQIQLNANTPAQQSREGCSCWVRDVSKINK